MIASAVVVAFNSITIQSLEAQSEERVFMLCFHGVTTRADVFAIGMHKAL